MTAFYQVVPSCIQQRHEQNFENVKRIKMRLAHANFVVRQKLLEQITELHNRL